MADIVKGGGGLGALKWSLQMLIQRTVKPIYHRNSQSRTTIMYPCGP